MSAHRFDVIINADPDASPVKRRPVLQIVRRDDPVPGSVNSPVEQIGEPNVVTIGSRETRATPAGPAPPPAPQTVMLPHEEASDVRKVTTLILLHGAPFVLCPAAIVGTVATVLGNVPVAMASIATAIVWSICAVEALRYRKNWRQRLTTPNTQK